jgi:predicted small metal-binding protein
MKTELCFIECGPECGFKVQSHDGKEVITIAMKHAKEKHNMNVSEEQLKSMVKTVEAK